MVDIFDIDGGGGVEFKEFIMGLNVFSAKENKEKKLRCK
jgi:Ca2+-binding EF-hand superfamily protein